MVFQAESNSTQNNRGVLLLHMGGPRSLAEVPIYLRKLFSDPHMIPVPSGRFLRSIFAGIMALVRTRESQNRYQQIGGKSPLSEQTETLRNTLSDILGCTVVSAARYSEPDIFSAINILKQKKLTQLVLLPLYPHYSTVTTLSSLEQFKHMNLAIDFTEIIESFCLEPEFQKSVADQIVSFLPTNNDTSDIHILFAAHSLPLSLVKKGDPYVDQVFSSAKGIIAAFPIDVAYSVAFQSRVGPVKWQGPTLNEAILKLSSKKSCHLIIYPLSFIHENLETLYDLDICLKSFCLATGLKSFTRIPTIGSWKPFTDVLAGLIRNAFGKMELPYV
ncbi:ferrochelatase [bacterium]|nr:ferrochelatase [candidate division CSSED10-310 bacterium]